MLANVIFYFSLAIVFHATVLKAASAQQSFVGLMQVRIHHPNKEIGSVALIGLIGTFSNKPECQKTLRGFVGAFVSGNAKENVQGDVDAT